MKKSIVLILILFIFVQTTYQIQIPDKITSLDPVTVRSPGNFNNIAPEVSEIIVPQYTGPKLSVNMLITKEKKNCNGEKEKHIDRHYAYYDVENKKIIKPNDKKELFGISSEKKPDVKDDKDKKPNDSKASVPVSKRSLK
jgi:hypothetical protein